MFFEGNGTEDEAAAAEGGVGEDEGVCTAAEEQTSVYRSFQGAP